MDTRVDPQGTTSAEPMMGDMMMNMTGMMKDLSLGKMEKMSVTKHLAKEMMNMSGVMGSGMMSDRELEKMHVRMAKIQKKMSEMEIKKSE